MCNYVIQQEMETKGRMRLMKFQVEVEEIKIYKLEYRELCGSFLRKMKFN